jgi:glutathione S-transferase
MRLYDFHDSGNGYKVRLALSQLGHDYDYHEVDILGGQSRTQDFLSRNPNGRIPVLELDDGTCLSESGAILAFLAEGTHLLPEERLARARVLQWMFFEQYSHEPYIATVRFWMKHQDPGPERERRIIERRPGGRAALAVMEQHLRGRSFFVDDRYSIADIALYAYTHVADEGGYDLREYPAVGDWIARVQEQPGWIALTAAAPAAAAAGGSD